MSLFKKATRAESKLKIAVTGPSGSGKTYSSLLIAKGMGKKVAVVDTENGSANLYSDKFDFDVATMNPPYTVKKYITAIEEAEKAGYDVLGLDSISHGWSGEGGLLDKKAQMDATGRGNSYTNWAKMTPEHNLFVAKILNANIHIICTMRSKVEYIIEDVNGKKIPRKVGMAPIQRDGFEYELSLVLELGLSHVCEVSKDRTSLFDGTNFTPSEKTGETLIEWLNSEKKEPEKENRSDKTKTKETK